MGAWENHLAERRQEFRSFADLIGAPPKDGGLLWSDGQFLHLHFDLMPIGRDGQAEDRASVYNAIEKVIGRVGGHRLTESAYAIRLLPGQSAERCAALLWNALSKGLDGMLRAGDRFYLHSAQARENPVGSIAQLVDEPVLALTKITPPDA